MYLRLQLPTWPARQYASEQHYYAVISATVPNTCFGSPSGRGGFPSKLLYSLNLQTLPSTVVFPNHL